MRKLLLLLFSITLGPAGALASGLYSSNPFEVEKFRYVYGDYSSARIEWKDFQRFNEQLSLLTNNNFISESFPENIQFIGLGTGYVFGGFGFEVAYRQSLNWATADNSFRGARGYTRVFLNYAEATLSFPRADGEEHKTVFFFGSVSLSANFFKWEIFNPNLRWRRNSEDVLPAAGGTANLFIDDQGGSVYYTSQDGGTESMTAEATSIGFSPAVNLALRLSDNFGMFGSLSTTYLTAMPLQSSAGYNIFIPDSLRDPSAAASTQKSAKDLTVDVPISTLNIKFCYYF